MIVPSFALHPINIYQILLTTQQTQHAYILCNKNLFIKQWTRCALSVSIIQLQPKEIRRTLMTKTLKVFTMILATFAILGTGSVSAHHDDAKGSGVVYEGAGGR